MVGLPPHLQAEQLPFTHSQLLTFPIFVSGREVALPDVENRGEAAPQKWREMEQKGTWGEPRAAAAATGGF